MSNPETSDEAAVHKMTEVVARLSQQLTVQSNILTTALERLIIIEKELNVQKVTKNEDEKTLKSKSEQSGSRSHEDESNEYSFKDNSLDKEKFKVAKQLLEGVSICNGNDARKLISFIIELDRIFILKIINDDRIIPLVMLKLREPLSSWWFRQIDGTCLSWKQLKTTLINYLSPIHRETL